MDLRFRKVRQKRKAHPLVRKLIDKMNEQGIGVMELCKEVGMHKNGFANWKRSVPLIDNLEACFNVVGYTLVPVPLTADKPLRNRKEYTLTDPNGNDVRVLGLSEFCKERGLHYVCMSQIIDKPTRSYRGWRIRHADASSSSQSPGVKKDA